MADRLMRAQTAQKASYFRLPYEGDDEESMRDDAPGILRAQQLGYSVVTHDFDPHDWAYASGQKTGPIPMPPLGEQDNITVLRSEEHTSELQSRQYLVCRLLLEKKKQYILEH